MKGFTYLIYFLFFSTFYSVVGLSNKKNQYRTLSGYFPLSLFAEIPMISIHDQYTVGDKICTRSISFYHYTTVDY